MCGERERGGGGGGGWLHDRSVQLQRAAAFEGSFGEGDETGWQKGVVERGAGGGGGGLRRRGGDGGGGAVTRGWERGVGGREREREGERREGGPSIAGATGAGNASLGYPVTKLVRFVQRGPRHAGLSPLKMVQLKPHCSDAAALERDTRQALHRKPEANSLSDAHLLA